MEEHFTSFQDASIQAAIKRSIPKMARHNPSMSTLATGLQ